MPEAAPKSIYRIQISLRHVKPPVWRRIEVPADISLDRLHQVLQVVMDWSDYHLHCFRVGRVTYGIPDPDFPHDTADEQGVPLDRIANSGDGLVYEYDFGDAWEHALKIEAVAPADPGVAYPRCLAGKRACPPEDCGGVGGYQNLLEILANPQDEEYTEMREWAGADFDPEAFDLDAINAELRAIEEHGYFPEDDEEPDVDTIAAMPGAIPGFTAAHAAQLREFLAAPGRPDGTMPYEQLAGFVFAIACSPELTPPSEWLLMVFNDQEAGYATLDEAQQVLTAVMALYNRTLQGMDEQHVELPPGIDIRTPAAANFDAASPLSQWARGFTEGHGYLEELWDAYTPESLDEELGGCMMVLSFFSSRELAEAYRSEFKNREPTVEETAENILRLFPDAMKSYAHLAWSIQTVLREHHEPPVPARSDKIGRNEPCPCGSGKKFKNCCGKNG